MLLQQGNDVRWKWALELLRLSQGSVEMRSSDADPILVIGDEGDHLEEEEVLLGAGRAALHDEGQDVRRNGGEAVEEGIAKKSNRLGEDVVGGTPRHDRNLLEELVIERDEALVKTIGRDGWAAGREGDEEDGEAQILHVALEGGDGLEKGWKIVVVDGCLDVGRVVLDIQPTKDGREKSRGGEGVGEVAPRVGSWDSSGEEELQGLNGEGSGRHHLPEGARSKLTGARMVKEEIEDEGLVLGGLEGTEELGRLWNLNVIVEEELEEGLVASAEGDDDSVRGEHPRELLHYPLGVVECEVLGPSKGDDAPDEIEDKADVETVGKPLDRQART